MKPSPAARTKSRQFLVQALYQAQLSDATYAEVAEPFIEDHNMKRADLDYFRDALRAIDQDEQSLREMINVAGDKTFDELDPIERGVLLLGCYELKTRIDVPFRVVINEAIELAQSFGATDSYKYVNSVLDKLAADLRPHG